MSSILTAPLFAYDKSKNLLLKAVLPFLIIVHHVLIALPSNGLQFIEQYGGHIAMFAFFVFTPTMCFPEGEAEN